MLFTLSRSSDLSATLEVETRNGPVELVELLGVSIDAIDIERFRRQVAPIGRYVSCRVRLMEHLGAGLGLILGREPSFVDFADVVTRDEREAFWDNYQDALAYTWRRRQRGLREVL